MKKAVINRAYFERCLLFLCGEGKIGNIGFKSSDLDTVFLPLYKTQEGDKFAVCFDLASGLGGKPLRTASFELIFDGEVDFLFDEEKDFSDNGGVYKIGLISDELGVTLFSTYEPTKVSVKQKIGEMGLRAVFKTADILPKNGRRVLFTSQSRKELSGNEKFVFDEILRRDELKNRLKIKFSLSNKGDAKFLIRTAWLLGRSDTVILDDYHPIVYLFKYKKGVKIAQLWHACGAFKTFGYSRLGKEGAPRFDGKAHRCYTHAFVSGDEVRKYYAEAFGVPMERVYATGVPRCDNLKNDQTKRDKFTVLFAPTFRGNGAKSAHYPYDKLDFDRLYEVCKKNNMKVIFKMHPFVKEKPPITENQADLFEDMSESREINELLPRCDLVITDYSSVVYEAALLNKSMLFYTFDLDEYVSSRDFYEPFEAFVPGKIVTEFDGLISALENKDFESEKVKTFREKNFISDEKSASSRVIDVLFGE